MTNIENIIGQEEGSIEKRAHLPLLSYNSHI
jgi:hypothetical protein